jgi:hypothetical protein
MEEELVNVDTTLLHPPLHIPDAHLLELPLHHLQALALHITHDTSSHELTTNKSQPRMHSSMKYIL